MCYRGVNGVIIQSEAIMKIEQVKSAMANKSHVDYQGCKYYITACILRIYKNQWYYQLELHDLNANSIVIANMDVVERI